MDGDLFGKNLENWSPNGLLLRSKSPYPLKFLAFHKKINKFQHAIIEYSLMFDQL